MPCILILIWILFITGICHVSWFFSRMLSIAAQRDHFLRRLSVCPSLCLSSSHTFLVVTPSHVSQATHAFLGMLPLCCLLQVYAMYPDFDLTDRRDFIRDTVKEVNLKFFLESNFTVFAPALHDWLDIFMPVVDYGSNDQGHVVFDLSVCLSVVNFNIHYNFWTVRNGDFIFGQHTPLKIPFQMTPRSMTLWPWL